MSNIALIDYFVLAALVLTTVFIVRGAIAHVTSAIGNGRLKIKGVVYERQARPLMFWLAVLFWVALSVFMLTVNVYAVLAVLRTA
jgi:hypothetical protein